MKNAQNLSANHKRIVIWSLLLSVGITTMATDIYVPSMPIMAAFFGTTKEMIQLSVPIVLFGTLLTMLILGRLSDSLGRRQLTVVPMFLYFILMCLSAAAETIEFFWSIRFVAGIVKSSSQAIVLAIIADIMPEKEAEPYYSYFTLVILISFVVAPVLGGYYASIGVWQYAFLTLAALSLINAVLLHRYLPETLTNKRPLVLRGMFQDFIQILKNPEFLKYSLTSGILIGTIFGYTLNSAFYYINTLGMDAFTFSLHQLALSGTGMVVSYLLGDIMVRYDLVKLNANGLLFSALGAGVFAVMITFVPDNPIALTASMVLFGQGVIVNMTTANPLIFRLFPNARGSAASMAGFIRTGSIMSIVAVSTLLYRSSPIEMAYGVCGFTVLGIFLYKVLDKR